MPNVEYPSRIQKAWECVVIGVAKRSEPVTRQSIIEGTLQHHSYNNLRRADYYLHFWFHNPEVLWALLAHGVSRNIGYLMGDLRRFAGQVRAGGPVDPMIEVFARNAEPIYALLEAYEYLIFCNVCPQLEVYKLAEESPEHSAEYFQMLVDHFGVDPWLVGRWREFHALAQTGFPDWGSSQPARQAVWEHTMALVVNAEHQVEDRLIHGSAQPYLAPFRATATWLIDLFDVTGFLRYGVPMLPEPGRAVQQNLRVYTQRNMIDLGARVEASRQLTAGLFLTDWPKCARLVSWVKLNRFHHGTRVDYNPHDFSLDPDGQATTGRRYSPPVCTYGVHPGAWPERPADTPEYGHLHARPAPLSQGIRERYMADLPGWLAPFAGDPGVTTHALSDLAEVIA